MRGEDMVTIAVCDDNIQFARVLTDKIKDICAFKIPERYMCQVAVEMHSSAAVLDYIAKNTINILFLDIDMPEMNGFELAEKINRLRPDTIIIFVSSHENFVFSSFEYNPFRFLRKNKLNEELEDALIKAVERHMSNTETVIIKTDRETVELRVIDILYIVSEKNYYAVCGVDFEYKCRGTMAHAEELIQKYSFFRINSGCFVNLERIKRFESPNKIILENTELYISQRKVSAFKEAYMLYTRKRVL